MGWRPSEQLVYPHYESEVLTDCFPERNLAGVTLSAFLRLHRTRLVARFEHLGEYEWPYVAVNPRPDRDDPSFRGDFLYADVGDGDIRIATGFLRTNSEGLLIVSRLTVEHWPPDREVTGAVVRALPIATMRDLAVAKLPAVAAGRRFARDIGDEWISEPEAELAERAAAEAAKPRPGRPGNPEAHYERIAIRYLELIDGGRRDVLKALTEEESAQNGRVVPRETVRDWVRRATALGFLAPGTPGRAEPRPGPRLTPKPTKRTDSAKKVPKQRPRGVRAPGAVTPGGKS
jgi:hypothetical protein